MSNHTSLDIVCPEGGQTNWIGSPLFLSQSYLELQTEETIVNIFKCLMFPDEAAHRLLCKLDAPQIVLPGSTQDYLGYADTGLSGLLTLSEQPTKDNTIPPGTLVIYDPARVSREYFPANPAGSGKIYFGIRLGFVEAGMDPISTERSMMFFHGQCVT